jgi:heme/copper-type cytochrome/quinol oxidase subunit 3
MVVLMLVSASLYGCLMFSYLFLWTVSPDVWPSVLPSGQKALVAGGLLAGSSAVVAWTDRRVKATGDCRGLGFAMPMLAAGWALAWAAQRHVSPAADAYGAVVYMFISVDGFFVTVSLLMALLALARHAAGKIDAERRMTFDNAKLFWHYTVAQALVGMALVHGFPRLLT